MSALIKICLVLLLATALTSLALFDSGQISMVWQDWVIETTVTFALFAVLILFGMIYLALRLVFNLLAMPNFLKHRRKFKQYARGEALMAKGMLALEYGDWKTAEKQLIKTAKKSEAGLVHYLNAAKMAHNQGIISRQTQYLEEARKRFPDDYIMIGIVESRLLQDKKPNVSEAILSELHAQNPRDRVVLAEYADILSKRKNWTDLKTTIPLLKKFKALSREDVLDMELEMAVAMIASSENLELLDSHWKSLPKLLKNNPKVITEYVEKCFGWEEESGVARLIEKSLAKTWDDRLVYQYGRIKQGPAFERLKKAEPWAKKHPNNPIVFLTLGRLACMSQLWGQGQFFLKKSLQTQPEVETFHALAKCYESEGANEQAALIYKEAILQLGTETAKTPIQSTPK